MRRRVMRTLARTDAVVVRGFFPRRGAVELPVWAMRLAAESGRDIQVVSWLGRHLTRDGCGGRPPTYNGRSSVVITLRSAGSIANPSSVALRRLWQHGTDRLATRGSAWCLRSARRCFARRSRNPGTTATVSISASWGFAIVHLLDDPLQARFAPRRAHGTCHRGGVAEHHRYSLGDTCGSQRRVAGALRLAGA